MGGSCVSKSHGWVLPVCQPLMAGSCVSTSHAWLRVSISPGWVLCVKLSWIDPVCQHPLWVLYAILSLPTAQGTARGTVRGELWNSDFYTQRGCCIQLTAAVVAYRRLHKTKLVKIPAHLQFSPQSFFCLDGSAVIRSCGGRVSHSPLRTLLPVGHLHLNGQAYSMCRWETLIVYRKH